MKPGHPRWLASEKAELVLLLSLEGMGRSTALRLLNSFGSPSTTLEALSKGAATSAGFSPDLAASWAEGVRRNDPSEILRNMDERKIRVVVVGEREYPDLLSEIHDPPLALFLRGELPAPEATCVSIVGSRKATPYGLEVAEWLSRGISREGMHVVSGAAIGIDSVAHAGALHQDRPTTAVLGCGVDVVYPRTNASLFERIRRRGCLMSEYLPNARPLKHHFPARNRLIAGLARAVVVVEASEKSGALLTADFALEEGREVMAVPGSVLSSNSRGTNALIRKGATPVTSPSEILEGVGYSGQGQLFRVSNPGVENEKERAICDALSCGGLDLEDLSLAVNMSVPETLAAVSSLEIRGLVRRGPGGQYQRCAIVNSRDRRGSR